MTPKKTTANTTAFATSTDSKPAFALSGTLTAPTGSSTSAPSLAESSSPTIRSTASTSAASTYGVGPDSPIYDTSAVLASTTTTTTPVCSAPDTIIADQYDSPAFQQYVGTFTAIFTGSGTTASPTSNQDGEYYYTSTDFPGTMSTDAVVSSCGAFVVQGLYTSLMDFAVNYDNATQQWQCVAFYDPSGGSGYYAVPDADAGCAFAYVLSYLGEGEIPMGSNTCSVPGNIVVTQYDAAVGMVYTGTFTQNFHGSDTTASPGDNNAGNLASATSFAGTMSADAAVSACGAFVISDLYDSLMDFALNYDDVAEQWDCLAFYDYYQGTGFYSEPCANVSCAFGYALSYLG